MQACIYIYTGGEKSFSCAPATDGEWSLEGSAMDRGSLEGSAMDKGSLEGSAMDGGLSLEGF